MIQPTKISTLIVILMVFLSFGIKSNTVDDYGAYHQKVIQAETFIAAEAYDILDPPIDSLLLQTNTLRESIYARPYALRDSLVKIEEKTGMDFYLSDRWY